MNLLGKLLKLIFKKIIFKYKIIILCGVIIAILFFNWTTIISIIENSANYLYGPDAENKGKILTIILTIVDGLGALWGLFFNNKKVNELVRQNDIAIQNSNDKRFGEAIGYLNSDNEGIAIGGIYALYQLAKEDSRYAPIITNIFYSYVNNNKHKEVTVQTIITLLFSENNPFIYDKELIFKDLSLKNLKMYCTISKIKFVTCSFDSVDLSGECSVSFYECSMKHSLIYDFKDITMIKGKYIKINICNLETCDIQVTVDEFVTNIMFNRITNLYLDIKKIEDVNIYIDTADEVYINNISIEQILTNLFLYYSSEIKSLFFNNEPVEDRKKLNIISDDSIKRMKKNYIKTLLTNSLS